MLGIAHAMAPPAGGAGADGGAGALLTQMAPILLMFGIFYLLLIRPQQKKAAEHRQMLDALKEGDAVVTSGGIHGRVVKTDGEELVVEIADKVRVRVNRSAIGEVKRKGAPAQPAKADDKAKAS